MFDFEWEKPTRQNELRYCKVQGILVLTTVIL